MTDDASSPDLLTLTAEIVAAFVANNSMKPEDLPRLIADTHASLAAVAVPSAPAEPEAPEFVPAVSVRKSLAKSDVILSMLDGKPYKTLRRHLAARGLTPEAYRARYNLPRDYPMVAPDYSEARRETAKRLGLGRKPKATGSPARPAAGKRQGARARQQNPR